MKPSSEASQALEYPEALVEMQNFGPTLDFSEFLCGRPENLHFLNKDDHHVILTLPGSSKTSTEQFSNLSMKLWIRRTGVQT